MISAAFQKSVHVVDFKTRRLLIMTKCRLLRVVCWSFQNVYVANSVDPDQTAPLGAVWSGSTLITCIGCWNISVMRATIYAAPTNKGGRHFYICIVS